MIAVNGGWWYWWLLFMRVVYWLQHCSDEHSVTHGQVQCGQMATAMLVKESVFVIRRWASITIYWHWQQDLMYPILPIGRWTLCCNRLPRQKFPSRWWSAWPSSGFRNPAGMALGCHGSLIASLKVHIELWDADTTWAIHVHFAAKCMQVLWAPTY